MALTPEDVVNKRFQPTKFREGYDQDEVDDFLDEVVVELRRLNQENEELRQRLVSGDSRIQELQNSAAQAPQQQAPQQQAPAYAQPVAEQHAPQQSYEQQAPEQAPPQAAAYAAPAAPVVAAPPVEEAPAAPAEPYANADSSGDPNNTNNLLQLARRLHEEHVREGVEKRDALIAEGQAAAERLVQEAEATQHAAIGNLEEERKQLEAQVDELRNFEREYRQKLKGYIEGQLRELDASASMTAGGVPANAAPAYAAPAAAQQTPAAPNYTGFGGAN
ncbi:MAG: DivIVA domain-containing protein [Microbacteriaceae bacterium]